MFFVQRDLSDPMSGNGLQAGVSFLLVQVKHLSVNTQKITPRLLLCLVRPTQYVRMSAEICPENFV